MYTDRPVPHLVAEKRKVILLPIGSCEQHGPYLPIDTDLRIAQLLANKVAKAFSEEDTLLLPAMPFSCSWEHKGLGTLALTVGTLAAMLHDIAYSLKTWRVPVLLILVNWHGGNDMLASLAAEITAHEGIPTAVLPSTSQVNRAGEQSNITHAKDIHAGAIETSIVQAYWPDLVALPIPECAHYEPEISPAKVQSVLQSIGSYSITKKGIWGAPEHADAEKGYALIEALSASIHEQVIKLLELVNI